MFIFKNPIAFLCALCFVLYVYSRIHFSVSTSSATDEISEMKENNLDESGTKAIIQNPKKEDVRQVASKEPAEITVDPAQFLREDRLCDFYEHVKEKNISQVQQFKYLFQSFTRPQMFLGAEVFFAYDEKNIGESELAETYAVLKEMDILNLKGKTTYRALSAADYAKDFSKEDKLLVDRVWSLIHRDSKNILYSLMLSNIYSIYKDVPESISKSVFDVLEGANQHKNPILRFARNLYEQSKKNSAQFYLSQQILQKIPSLQHRFYWGGVWRWGGEDLSRHVAQILLKKPKNARESSATFSFETSAYKAARSMDSEIYYSTLKPEEFDKSKDQPVYTLSELSLDLSKGCDEDKVADYQIKLRSL